MAKPGEQLLLLNEQTITVDADVLMIADELQCRDRFIAATKGVAIASIGPTCTETILEEGLSVNFEASPPKMGPLVRGIIEYLAL